MSRSELGCLAVFLVFLCVALAVWQLVEVIRRSSRHALLERMLRFTQGELEKAQADIRALKAELAGLRGSALESTVPADLRSPLLASASEPLPPAAPPLPEPVPPRADPGPPRTESVSPKPVPVPPPPTIRHPVIPDPAATPSAPTRRPVITLPPVDPEPPSTPFDWESLIGVKLFSWIAGIFLFIAAILFVVYGVENGWITPPVQMTLVLALGVGLLVSSELERVRVFEVTAQAMAAAGVAILFVAFYGGTSGWKLIPGPVAFVFMAITAAVAVLLSIRRDSIFIALLGLLGGFATPALLSTGVDRAVGLFSYLLLLNLGLNFVAYRKNWPILKALSLALTALYQLGWVLKFLHESKLELALAIFLLFPVVTFGSILLARRRNPDTPEVFGRMSSLAALPPLLFALFLASVPAYGQHTGMLFGFTLIMAAGLAAVALYHGPEWLHPLGAASTLLVWIVWFSTSYASTAWPSLLVFLGLFLALYLGVPRLQARMIPKRPFLEGAQHAVLAAPLLLFAFPVLAAIEPAVCEPGLLFGVLAVFLVLLALHALRFEEGLVHFMACFFVLLTEALWSGRFLSPDNLIPALLIYGGFGLFYLGVPLLAQARGRELRPQGSGAILAFTSLLLLFFLAVGPIARVSLWALAVMVGILNLGLLYEASCGHRPVLALLGLFTSWILLGVWWLSAPLTQLLGPALVVLGGFAVMVVGGSFWLRARSPEGASGLSTRGLATHALFQGLVGHVFLFAVVAQPGLSMPPWPWLGVLLVLDLALGVAALSVRTGAVLVPAILLSQLLLLVWTLACTLPVTWHPVLVWTAAGLGGCGLLWAELARRRDVEESGFQWAAGLGLISAQIVLALFVLPSYPTLPSLPTLALAHTLLALGLLVLAWRSTRHGWVVALAFTGGAVAGAWRLGQVLHARPLWGAQLAMDLLLLALPTYLLLLTYPLALKERAEKTRLPFLAAVLGSLAFFFAGRSALTLAGLGGYIGALPVLQALLLVPHLLRLLRLEPVGRRDLGRLALVSGALLGFITVAIPLQLEKEWLTLGWALLGAALAWLYIRVPHKGILAWCGGLLAIVLVRLTFNPAMWDYHPRSAVPFLNWFLYTYLVAAACCFVAARILRERDDRFWERLPRLSTLFSIAGAVLLFWLVNIQIADLFSEGPALTFQFTGGGLAQQLAYTFGWALYALGLLIVGLIRHHRATRVTAIILLTATIAKAFLLDLAHLQGLYRVASFAGLAVCLGAVAVMLQKFVLKKGEPE